MPTSGKCCPWPTGRITGSLDELIRSSGIDPATAAKTPIATGSGVTILGFDADQVIDVESDRMLRVDLVAMTAVELPYPPALDGQSFLGVSFEIGPEGQLLHVANGGIEDRVPLAVEGGGTWVTDPAALADAWPATAGHSFSGDDLLALEAYDATGRMLWRRDDVVMAYQVKGSPRRVVGDVVVAVSCVLTDDAVQPCEEGTLGGYSMADGSTLWELDGWRAATAFGDGLAIVSVPSDTGAGGWMMIDTTTGEIVSSDQQWKDPAAFSSECCGGYEYFSVYQFAASPRCALRRVRQDLASSRSRALDGSITLP